MTESFSLLESRILGCLYGGAAGDAVGAPAEGRTTEEITARYGQILGLVEPWSNAERYNKGDGRFTDDTHMIQILGQIYLDVDDHLDVFEFAKRIVPPIADQPRYVAEFGKEMLLVERLFYPEKWLLMRLRLANCDPRIGGIGNMVNCGAAMYASPVGIVNAADPDRAYREAIEIFTAHQTSYGLEAAGVMAAAVAAAFIPGITVDEILETALRVSREGTRLALDAVFETAARYTVWEDALVPLRAAMAPYDGAADEIHDRGNGTDDWNPSRVKSIEEVPIALALLKVTNGDLQKSIFGGTNYGRDCDSIAGMAGAIAGAMHGFEAVPVGWVEKIDRENKCDMRPLARGLASLASRLASEDAAAVSKRRIALEQLAAAPVA
jgi:ADP-ribosylglycohydrolase